MNTYHNQLDALKTLLFYAFEMAKANVCILNLDYYIFKEHILCLMMFLLYLVASKGFSFNIS